VSKTYGILLGKAWERLLELRGDAAKVSRTRQQLADRVDQRRKALADVE
jgi:hypothetical protein